MKYRKYLLLTLALVMVLSSGCAGHPSDNTQPSGETVGSRETTVSLNGEWDFYVDTIENTGIYKNKEPGDAALLTVRTVFQMVGHLDSVLRHNQLIDFFSLP